MKQIEVVAAVIHDTEGRIFATQRGYGEWKDWWEFPGGKMEAGEKPEEALKREIREELSAEIAVDELLCTVEYDYPKFHLTMHCYLCSLLTETLQLNEHEAAKWLPKDKLDSVQWLPADLGVIEMIRNKMEQLERIGRMECLLEEAMQAVKGVLESLDRYEAAQSAIHALEAYYDSEEWMKDFSDDEQDRLPKELKRGVLSEDAIWNLLEENRGLKERMKGI